MPTTVKGQQVEALPSHNTIPQATLKMFIRLNPPPPWKHKLATPGTWSFVQTGSKECKQHKGVFHSRTLTYHRPAGQSSKKAEKEKGSPSPPALFIYLDEELFSLHHLPPAHRMSTSCLSFQAGIHCHKNMARTLIFRGISPQGTAVLHQHDSHIT